MFSPKHPLYGLCLCFVAGILGASACLSHKLAPSLPLWSGMSMGLALLCFFFYLRKGRSFKIYFSLLVGLLCLCLAFWRVALQENSFHRHSFLRYPSEALWVEIGEEPQERTKTYRCTLRVIAAGSPQKPIACRGKILAYFSRDSASPPPRYRQRYWIHAQVQEIEGPQHPDEFDSRTYWARKGVFHRVFLRADHVHYSGQAEGFSLRALAFELRSHLLQKLPLWGLDADEYGVAAALLLGYDDALDGEMRRAYQSAGAMHILCVSGLHLGLFSVLVMHLFAFLKGRGWRQYLRLFLVLLSIWLYALLTGFSPSVLRAACMFSFVHLGKVFDRKTSVYYALASSALFLLLVDPYMLFSLGFQLSYAAVLGIVAFQVKLPKRLASLPRPLTYFLELTTVSLGAQLATAPLAIYYFHQFPVYFLLSNWLASPLSAILLPFGMLVLALGSLHSFLGECLGPLLSLLIRLLNGSILAIESWPSSVIDGIHLSSGSLWAALAALIFGARLFKPRKNALLPFALSVTFLLSTLLYTTYHQRQQEDILVYHTPKGIAVEHFFGQRSKLWKNTALQENPSALDFVRRNHYLRRGIRECSEEILPESAERLRIDWGTHQETRPLRGP